LNCIFFGYYLLPVSCVLSVHNHIIHDLSEYSLRSLALGRSPLVKFVGYKDYCWLAFLVVADYLSYQSKLIILSICRCN
jgi:hypothetical protein